MEKGLLDEVKLLRCGFVDIPVGDFKESHLHNHPNLMVPEAPSVHFVQLEGEDLCVSNHWQVPYMPLALKEQQMP